MNKLCLPYRTIQIFINVFVSPHSLRGFLMQLLINMQTYKQQRESRGSRAVFSYIYSHDWTLCSSWYPDTVGILHIYQLLFTKYFLCCVHCRSGLSIAQEDVRSSWTLREGGKHCRRNQVVGLSESGNWFHYIIS